jgi:hypothetical protein
MDYSLLIKDGCEVCTKAVKFLVKNRIAHVLLTRYMPPGKPLDVPVLIQHLNEERVVIGGYEEMIKHFKKEK